MKIGEMIRPEWIRDALLVVKIVAIIAIPTALLVYHVWNQYRITQVGYEIASVTSEHRSLLEENKKLTVEARIQGRSDRVSALARTHFGLQETRPEQVITLDLRPPQLEGSDELAAR